MVPGAPRPLALALAGCAAMLLGLGWDAVLHARDPLLAHAEGPLTLSNPAHVTVFCGLALTTAGLLGLARARLGRRARRAVLAAASVVLALTAGMVVWASLVPPPSPPATPAERQRADLLLRQVRSGVTRYRDVRVARRDGYVPANEAGASLVHYVDPASFSDDPLRDPGHPQALVYADVLGRPVLVGAMFIVDRPGVSGPAPGGPLTVWHTHSDLCFTPDGRIAGSLAAGCPAGSATSDQPAMLHVWVVDNPGGPFAPDLPWWAPIVQRVRQ